MSTDLIDHTPQWMKNSKANSEWQAAQADYMADHKGLGAFEKLMIRLAAVERMSKIDAFYEDQEMRGVAA